MQHFAGTGLQLRGVSSEVGMLEEREKAGQQSEGRCTLIATFSQQIRYTFSITPKLFKS
jgi:hypothetical protein